MISQARDAKYYSSVRANRTKYSLRAPQAYWQIRTKRQASIDTLFEGIKLLKLFFEHDKKDIVKNCLKRVLNIFEKIAKEPFVLEYQTIPLAEPSFRDNVYIIFGGRHIMEGAGFELDFQFK